METIPSSIHSCACHMVMALLQDMGISTC
jgi:hypothetical protein